MKPGVDEGRPITLDGLTSVEQLITQIAPNDAQVNPTMPLLYGAVMVEEPDLLLTNASDAHPLEFRTFFPASAPKIAY